MPAVPTIVQKYGGSSLADGAALLRVAQQVVARQRQGVRLVVVVSAMGSTTDALLQQAHDLVPHPPQRELDMLVTTGERICMALLCMAVSAAGGQAVSLTGSQSGIITENAHQGARIVAIRPERIRAILDAGHIAIVAGYQGVSLAHEITTLGRGGSDTTAVALGAALSAEAVDIFSDVDGVYSADPRVCPQARHLREVSYTFMGDMAHFGAQVLHDQAVAFAQRAEIALWARSAAAPSGRATRLAADVAMAPHTMAVSALHDALWISAPAPPQLWALWPQAEAQGLQVVALGGTDALCVWQVAAGADGLSRARALVGSELRCQPVSAVTLVGQRPIDGALVAAAQRALADHAIPVRALWSGARSLTVAVAPGSAGRAVALLHALIPT